MTIPTDYMEQILAMMPQHVAQLPAGEQAQVDQWDASARRMVGDCVSFSDLMLTTSAAHGFIGACALVDIFIEQHFDIDTNDAANATLAFVQRLAWVAVHMLNSEAVDAIAGSPMPEDPED